MDSTPAMFRKKLLFDNFTNLLEFLTDKSFFGGKSNRINLLSTLSRVLSATKCQLIDSDDDNLLLRSIVQIDSRLELVNICKGTIAKIHSDSENDEFTHEGLTAVPSYEICAEAVVSARRDFYALAEKLPDISKRDYSRVLQIISGCLQCGQQSTRWMIISQATLVQLSAALSDGSSQAIYDSKHFKTRSVFKRQAIVFPVENAKLLIKYRDCFRRSADLSMQDYNSSNEPFFTNWLGRPLNSSAWNKKLRGFVALYFRGHSHVSATLLRSAMDTRASECQGELNIDLSALRKSDMHSSKVAEDYYNKASSHAIALRGAQEFSKLNPSVDYTFSTDTGTSGTDDIQMRKRRKFSDR